MDDRSDTGTSEDNGEVLGREEPDDAIGVQVAGAAGSPEVHSGSLEADLE